MWPDQRSRVHNPGMCPGPGIEPATFLLAGRCLTEPHQLGQKSKFLLILLENSIVRTFQLTLRTLFSLLFSSSFSLSHSLSFTCSLLSLLILSLVFVHFLPLPGSLVLTHACAHQSSLKLIIWCQVYVVASSQKLQKTPLTSHWPTLSQMPC